MQSSKAKGGNKLQYLTRWKKNKAPDRRQQLPGNDNRVEKILCCLYSLMFYHITSRRKNEELLVFKPATLILDSSKHMCIFERIK